MKSVKFLPVFNFFNAKCSNLHLSLDYTFLLRNCKICQITFCLLFFFILNAIFILDSFFYLVIVKMSEVSPCFFMQNLQYLHEIYTFILRNCNISRISPYLLMFLFQNVKITHIYIRFILFHWETVKSVKFLLAI